jgi:hypothetical protein
MGNSETRVEHKGPFSDEEFALVLLVRSLDETCDHSVPISSDTSPWPPRHQLVMLTDVTSLAPYIWQNFNRLKDKSTGRLNRAGFRVSARPFPKISRSKMREFLGVCAGALRFATAASQSVC